MTKHPDLFAALSAPFEPREVKKLPKGGRQLDYVTARTVMNRLDSVLGPENWWDEFAPSENSVLCRLTICLPDGTTLTKCDAGGYAGMADAGDDDKSGFSDAFKRAAAKFGVGRYLYKDGVPAYGRAAAGDGDGAEAGAPPPVREGRGEPPQVAWSRWVGKALRESNARWMREMVAEGVDPGRREEWRELACEPRVVNHLCTRLIELERVVNTEVEKDDKPGVRDPRKARAVVVEFFARAPGSIRRAVAKYLRAKRQEALAQLGMPDIEEVEAVGPAEPTEKAGAA